MNNLYELLKKIQYAPALYLDRPSITSLRLFLSGYLDARMGLGLDREGTIIDGFQKWMENTEKTKVSQSWNGILLFICGSERSAFYGFFRSFEEFLKQSKLSKEKSRDNLSSTEENIRYRVYDLYELLGWIKKRPGMYLGTSSITRLEMLLRGYNFARREVDVPLTEQEREFAGFQEWIEDKYGIKSGQSWGKIILFFSVDEHEALMKFFELFEEFLQYSRSE